MERLTNMGLQGSGAGAALGLRGDDARVETRRGGGGEPKVVGHEKVFRQINKLKPNTYPMV